ncbi:hypothetical protein M9Y10_026747 [Tritrichomonas musculus]|uniref:CRAL-TRIO domain-containing protein n=1 Tax=Tritrichomonas musculus TaxID=1915356 RepID=A0ABR2H6E9_9EUKA
MDESSFDEENMTLFIIQMQIIFETFSDKIDKLRRKQQGIDDDTETESTVSNNDNIFASHKRQKNEENEDKLLLTALNAIGSKGGFHFDNFHQAIKNNSLPRFNVSIKESTGKSLSNEEIKNIEAVIEFLKMKEKKFEILIFNFRKRSLQKPSAILFYRNFLNFFFLKTSQKEIFERFSTLLCTIATIQYDEQMIPLIDDKLMLAILHFILHGNIHYNNTEVTFLSTLQNYCDKVKIPFLITGRINMEYSFSRLPDSIFYQYQFMFNAIDSGPLSRHLIEKLLSGFKKIKEIHVPKFEIITASIKAKMKSIELQKEGIDQYQERMNRNSNNNNNNNNNDNNNDNVPTNTKEVITFKERRSISSKKEDIVLLDQKQSIIDAYKIWNPETTSYCFDNGIILDSKDKNEKPQKDWAKEISSSIQSRKEKRGSKENLFYSEKKNNSKSELYRFFIFNFETNQWKFDNDEFIRCLQEQRINITITRMPLISFLDSYEDDHIKIGSYFINGQFPDFNECKDSIFVYGFCEKSLSKLSFKLDSEDSDKVKPMFLFLHVPESRRNIPRIKSVITQIYSFLGIISDIKIIVMNKNHYLDQIKYMRQIDQIINNFHENIDYDEEKDDDDDDSFNGGDSGDENEDDESEEEESQNGLHNENYKKNFVEFIPKDFDDFGSIVLLNDPVFNSDENFDSIIEESPFFSNLKAQISDKCEMHFINVDNPDTYRSFLDNLGDAVIKTIFSATATKLIQKFLCSNMINQISKKYIQLKNSSQWTKELIQFLQQRYSSLGKDIKNPLSILFSMQEEIKNYIPNYDKEIYSECNNFISDMKKKYYNENRETIKTELKASSESNLMELQNRINKSMYWTMNQIEAIINGHVQFLKNEFLDIIKILYEEKIQYLIYSENVDILNSQIEEDRLKVHEIFKSFIEKINIKESIKEQNIQEGSLKTTNYTLKETENVREIKVTVQLSEDLKSVIEQDF